MRFCLLIALVLGALPVSVQAQALTHVRIDADNAPALAARLQAEGFDVLKASVRGGSFELIVSDEELALLTQRGYAPVTLAHSRPFRDIQAEWLAAGEDAPPGYPTLSQVLAELNARAAAYPTICRVVDLTATYNIPPTVEGRHLFAAKVSDNVAQDEDEPVFLLVGCHHARELVTPVIALEALSRLTSQYGSDPDITAAVNKYEIWIAPVWNPDGYEYVFNVNNMWRKNRHVFPTGVGVDQNRNYPFGWSGPCAGSTVVTSETYKGPSPASESETQTMIAWSDDRHFAKVVDYHSYGRVVVWGYGCKVHPFDTFLQSEAAALSSASGYGGNTDYAGTEGMHYQWQVALHASYAYLIETHTSFQPTYESAQAEARLVWPGVLWMLQRPVALLGRVTDAWNGVPVVAALSLAGVNFPNGEVNRSNGRFGRYHAFLPAGNYTAQFAATGYVARSFPVTVTPNSEQALDVVLTRRWPLGDLNCDGVVNNFDIDPFVLALTDPAGYRTRYPDCVWYNADCNNDGVVNNFDIDPFVKLLTP